MGTLTCSDDIHVVLDLTEVMYLVWISAWCCRNEWKGDSSNLGLFSNKFLAVSHSVCKMYFCTVRALALGLLLQVNMISVQCVRLLLAQHCELSIISHKSNAPHLCVRNTMTCSELAIYTCWFVCEQALEISFKRSDKSLAHLPRDLHLSRATSESLRSELAIYTCFLVCWSKL